MGSTNSVRVHPKIFSEKLTELLGNRSTLSDLPAAFKEKISAIEGINFAFDKDGTYVDEVNNWLLRQATKTISVDTRNTTSASLKSTLGWFEDNQLNWRVCTELAHINLMHLHFRGKAEDRRRARVAKSTWNLRIGYWVRFLQHGEREGFIDEVGFELDEVLERGKSERLIRALLPHEYRQLHRSATTQRLKAGMNVMVGTGLRSRENASLTVADVPPIGEFHEASYRPRVVEGKGAKRREILWPRSAAKSVWAYHRLERSLALNELRQRIACGRRAPDGPVLMPFQEAGRRVLKERADAPLWLNEEGEPLSGKRWAKEFTAAQDGAGTTISPHWLRHTFAIVLLTNLIKQQYRVELAMAKLGRPRQREYFRDPLDEVRRRLGHASIETTMIYLNHIAQHRQLLNAAVSDLEKDFMHA